MHRMREFRCICRRSVRPQLRLTRRVDLFAGTGDAQRLSMRLMRGEAAEIPDADVAAVLGDEPVAAFRFAEERLRGRRRRTTDEPVFCHSADIAMRALDLGYGPRTVMAGLLHDVVEEAAPEPEAMAALLGEVVRRFGADTGRDVRVLTNRYSALMDAVRREVPLNLPFVDGSREIVAGALRGLRDRMPPEVSAAYAFEFHQLLDYFLPRADVARGAPRALVDRGHSVFAELALQTYRVFSEDMADDARSRSGPSSGVFCETPLVVKCMDLVDNLRTAEVVSWRALDRILLKSEMFLDATFYLHDHLHGMEAPDVTFISAYDFLKHQMVEQMEERARALAYLADTRFAPLAEFLEGQLGRLRRKYQVGRNPVEGLARLRNRIRALNVPRRPSRQG